MWGETVSEIINRAYDAWIASMPLKEYLDLMSHEEKESLSSIMQETDDIRNRIYA